MEPFHGSQIGYIFVSRVDAILRLEESLISPVWVLACLAYSEVR